MALGFLSHVDEDNNSNWRALRRGRRRRRMKCFIVQKLLGRVIRALGSEIEVNLKERL